MIIVHDPEHAVRAKAGQKAGAATEGGGGRGSGGEMQGATAAAVRRAAERVAKRWDKARENGLPSFDVSGWG